MKILNTIKKALLISTVAMGSLIPINVMAEEPIVSEDVTITFTAGEYSNYYYFFQDTDGNGSYTEGEPKYDADAQITMKTGQVVAESKMRVALKDEYKTSWTGDSFTGAKYVLVSGDIGEIEVGGVVGGGVDCTIKSVATIKFIPSTVKATITKQNQCSKPEEFGDIFIDKNANNSFDAGEEIADNTVITIPKGAKISDIAKIRVKLSDESFETKWIDRSNLVLLQDDVVVDGDCKVTTDSTFKFKYNGVCVNHATVKIEYVFEDGSEAQKSYSKYLSEKSTYDIKTPEIAGYTADKTEVKGTMGTDDVSYKITYKKVVTPTPTPPVVTPTPTVTPTATPEATKEFVVTLLDCSGKTVSVQKVKYGEDVKVPGGYTYKDTDVKNITANIDAKPTTCKTQYKVVNTGVDSNFAAYATTSAITLGSAISLMLAKLRKKED